MTGELTSPEVPVRPGTGRWRELVAEAIRRDAARNWFLGDAALEIAPWSETGVNTGALAALRQFAVETGINYDRIYQCRAVAAWWPPADRIEGTLWTVHRILAAEAYRHLIQPGMTTGQARTALESAPRALPAAAGDRPRRTVEEAAREFGRWIRHGYWVAAVHVACCVQIGADTPEKASVAEFAQLAGADPARVMAYLVAWELAAAAGGCLHAASLTPGDDPELPPFSPQPGELVPGLPIAIREE